MNDAAGRDQASESPGPTVAETHISTVFFTRDRAYKILKPVKTHFLDYSTSGLRISAAKKEFLVNSEMAPDVYLGTADVVEHGQVVDRMIVMRRLPSSRRLTERIATPFLDDDIRRIARVVAAYHAGKGPILDADDIAGVEAVRSNWEDNFREMAPLVGVVLASSEVARVHQLATSFLDNHAQLFQARIDDGQVRAGHGDLTAEDIFCLDDGPRIIDGLAFSDRLRISDVLADICFLAMDLDRLAGPDAARKLMRNYRSFSNEHHPPSLAHHYVAYRAHVRAKIAGMRYQQGDSEAGALMRSYHSLALSHLERARSRVVVIGGSPGTGKTTVANGLADELDWMVLTTDELRKDIAGRAHGKHVPSKPDEGIYRPDVTARTYEALIRQADSLLTRGESVILDASWNTADHRDTARDLARRHGAEFVEIQCMLPPGLAKERIRGRLEKGTDASDATPELVDTLRQRQQPWPSAKGLDTSGTPDDAIALALRLVCAPIE